MNNQIIQKIKKAPSGSGVYIFKNRRGEIIYVGRAVNLKRRLINYLRPNDPKTRQMTEAANSVTLRRTNNLIEAIIEEANLIKEKQPQYNIREKDDRSFIYIAIPQTAWTYPLLVRGHELQKYPLKETFVFGPLRSLSLARNFLLLLRKIFPYSTCRQTGQPCFYYQIGLCPGKCLGLITENDYRRNIDNLKMFLAGDRKKVFRRLAKEQPEKIALLQSIDDSLLITREENKKWPGNRIEAYDISHLAGQETVGAMVVAENGEIKKQDYRLFKIKNAKPGDDLAAIAEMIERRFRHAEWRYPDLILIDGGKTQVATVAKILKQERQAIPIVGIAKYQKERLVFGKMKKSLKEMIELSFDNLKTIRDEAHRFANAYRKRLLAGKMGGKNAFIGRRISG